ncbi:FAD-binding domain-containing protein [Xylariomycetidae sp. FL2044]|nr:FAD-binding domain-containing protein [Xylariomycetidae sp. FL2044]
MSAYFLNDSCNPFLNSEGDSCTLGNLASYAINVSTAFDVVAGINFAQDHNLRLTVKNTGHDFLGRSTGKGALALWTHYLNKIDFLDYDSKLYSGPAIRMGAGVQSFEVSQAASERGLRVVGGFCPTVGIAGGWVGGAGHGPLGSKYGLGADNALEFDVVTVDGRHIVPSPTENEDLFWALSGGGPGNFAVVLSVTLKAHPDGQVAGAQWIMPNTNDDAFWVYIETWMKYLLIYDKIPGLSVNSGFNQQMMILNYASFPDATAEDLDEVFAPFLDEIKHLPLNFSVQDTQVHATWEEHFQYFTQFPYDTHNTNGGRLIPRALVQDNLPVLLTTLRGVVTNTTAGVGLIGGNYSYSNMDFPAGYNAVLPSWRGALVSINILIGMESNSAWTVARDDLAQMNVWQGQLRALTPGGGTYMNEATYDNPNWKEDYFGENYARLLEVKHKYDPSHVLWGSAAVGSDEVWALADDGRLCAHAKTE